MAHYTSTDPTAANGSNGRVTGIPIVKAVAAMVAAAFLAFPPMARAFSNFVGEWQTLYPASASATNAGCPLCHTDSSTSEWNGYGWALRQLGTATAIATRITTVQASDSDGDPAAASNLAEINANTQPGWTVGAHNSTYNSAGLITSTATAPAGIAGFLDIPYTVGGNVSGLTGSVTLQNNGGDNLVRGANGAFTFATPLVAGSAYAVTVSSQPAGQTCAVTNGSGTIAAANVTNVAVACVTNTYTVGGSVSGLIGSVTLQNNGGDSLVRGADGAFTFATALTAGSAYAVTVSSQPAGQTCTVTNGSGTIASANVTNVAVTCVNKYTVGGSVSGLTGSVTLQNNGGDNLVRGTDGAFTFATPLAAGSAYAVTVSSQPAGQTCTVTNGSGTIAAANVTNVAVTCVTAYTVGGSVSGLSGSVTLQNNGGDNLVRGADGAFTFGTALLAGSAYAVTVSSQPAGQNCTVANGSGTIAVANVTNVAVTCATLVRSFTGALPSGATGTLSFTTTDPGCSFAGSPQFLSAAGIAPAPPAAVTPIDGVVQFTIDSCAPGATVNLSMDYGSPLPPDAAYWKTGNPWYPLAADVRGSIALFSITDGATGDADGSADGRIVDPSGAVLVSVVVAPTGVTAVPALTPWALTALSMLLVLAAAFARRRQRR